LFGITPEPSPMPNLHVLPKDELSVETPRTRSFPTMLVVQWAVGVVVVFTIGTWLVWWAASVQRTFIMEDIRTACQRVMPEMVERCVDTVIVQRGGARR
jgi:hypothetical protein